MMVNQVVRHVLLTLFLTQLTPNMPFSSGL